MEIYEQIDSIDAEILSILQQQARVPNAEIARRVGMVPSAIFERIKKLEKAGVIQGYRAQVSPSALGLSLLAFIFVRAEDPSGSLRTAELMAEIPETEEVYHLAGEDCYLIKVRASNTQELGKILRRKIGTLEGVRSTRTTIVLTVVKEMGCIPIPKLVTEREQLAGD